jgi:hypothetical protein
VLTVCLFAAAFLGVRLMTHGMDLRDVLERVSVPDRAQGSVAPPVPADAEQQRDKLREDVLAAATAFAQSHCDNDLKERYIAAATAYVRGFLTLSGCAKYPACAVNDPRVAQAVKAFDTSADLRVKQAIRDVHLVAVGIQDYPDNLGPVIVWLSGSGFIRQGRYWCTESRSGFFEHTRVAPTHYIDDHPRSRPFGHYVPPTRAETARVVRDSSRNVALEALRSPNPSMCVSPGHAQLVGMVSQYYRSRDAALSVNAIQNSQAQAENEAEWSTPVDQQIDGLVRGFYADGYLRPSDLMSPTAQKVLSGITWTGRACAR